jgi:DNA-binding transcriptional regulator YiaG
MRVMVEVGVTTGYVPPVRPTRQPGAGLGVIALTLIGVTSITTAAPAAATTAILRDAALGSTHITLTGTNSRSLGTLVKKLKEDTGLTWAQFAGLFGVSRRAVHFWVEDGQMSAQNLERYERLTAKLQHLQGLDPAIARVEILTPGANGSSLYRELVSEVTRPKDLPFREPRPLGSDDVPSGLGATGIPAGTEDVHGITLRRR